MIVLRVEVMTQDQDNKELSDSEELQGCARELWESGDDLELAQAIVAGYVVWDRALSDRCVWQASKDHDRTWASES